MVGRFQPFHKGHLAMVEELAGRFDEVVLVVGSAQKSHTLDNPFTAGERIEMVRAATADAGVDNAVVVAVPDLHRNALWVHHVETYIPRVDVVVTHNPLPARLFSEAGYDVEQPAMTDRERFEGARVRQALLEDAGWEDLVPPAVARLVKEFDGTERLRDVEGGSGGLEDPRG